MACSRLLGALVCVGDMETNSVLLGGLGFDAPVRPSLLPRRPRLLYLTHGHADHFRYAYALREAGAAVAAPRLCLPMVEDPRINHMATTGWAGPVEEAAITRYFLGRGVRVDLLVEPGCLGGGVEAVAAPGHTPGHLVYVVEAPGGRLLVAGDAVFGPSYMERVPVPYHTNTVEWLSTLRRLAGLGVDAVVPGHGEPVEGSRGARRLVEENARHVEEALRLVERVLPGPGEEPVYADEVAARLAEEIGFGSSRRAYSVLSPTVRALLLALRERGVAEAVLDRGVPRWRRRAT